MYYSTNFFFWDLFIDFHLAIFLFVYSKVQAAKNLLRILRSLSSFRESEQRAKILVIEGRLGMKVGESLTTTKFKWPWESQICLRMWSCTMIVLISIADFCFPFAISLSMCDLIYLILPYAFSAPAPIHFVFTDAMRCIAGIPHVHVSDRYFLACPLLHIPPTLNPSTSLAHIS